MCRGTLGWPEVQTTYTWRKESINWRMETASSKILPYYKLQAGGRVPRCKLAEEQQLFDTLNCCLIIFPHVKPSSPLSNLYVVYTAASVEAMGAHRGWDKRSVSVQGGRKGSFTLAAHLYHSSSSSCPACFAWGHLLHLQSQKGQRCGSHVLCPCCSSLFSASRRNLGQLQSVGTQPQLSLLHTSQPCPSSPAQTPRIRHGHTTEAGN